MGMPPVLGPVGGKMPVMTGSTYIVKITSGEFENLAKSGASRLSNAGKN